MNNVVFISSIWQGDSAICIHVSILFYRGQNYTWVLSSCQYFHFSSHLLLFKIISVLICLSKSFKNVAQNKGSVKFPRVKTRWRNMITWLVWLALVIIMSFQKTWRYLIHLIKGLMTGNIYLFLSSCLATLVTHTT